MTAKEYLSQAYRLDQRINVPVNLRLQVYDLANGVRHRGGGAAGIARHSGDGAGALGGEVI